MALKTATRQLILQAAVFCIEKYGLTQVTTRRIAAEAGTNIASINYYFRSKEDLIAETLSMTIKHMLQDVLISIKETKQPFDITLTNVISYLIDGSLRFPGITSAHLNQAIVSSRKDSISARAMDEVYEGLARRAAQTYPRKNRQLLRMRVSQIMSAVMFKMLAPDFFQVSRKDKLQTFKEVKTTARSYTELFLGAI